MDESLIDRAVPLGIAGIKGDGVRAVFRPELQELIPDLPVGLLPGDGFPLAAAPLPYATQGRPDPIRAGDVFLVGITQSAELTAVLGIGGRDLTDLFVFDLHVDGAAPGADAADAFSDFDSHGIPFFFLNRSSGSGSF